MIRCLQCNATLRPEEKMCYGCGAAVPEEHPKLGFGRRFQSVVKVLLVISAVLTVLSLFTDIVPSFTRCFGTMVILFFVKSSADQMIETGKN